MSMTKNASGLRGRGLFSCESNCRGDKKIGWTVDENGTGLVISVINSREPSRGVISGV
jgi:hypothetical protein